MVIGTGVEAFVERAESQLFATGEHARRRTVETREDLTAHEAEIARLGFSKREIVARLFISPKTVEYRPRKVFSKLGIKFPHPARPRAPATHRHGAAGLNHAGLRRDR